ncbi:MAG: DUF2231 domain-containing protein [Pseudomonadota bacterium]
MEPNWHPVIVHFVVAFFLTAPLFYLLTLMQPKDAPRRAALLAAADCMLALGALAAAAAVAAGLYAYATVAHDEPSHVAMTDHRNFALAAVALVALAAVWRFLRRAAPPSVFFIAVVFAASAAVATTAYKGGRLVYHFGLGVASLPTPEAGEHHHDHGAGGEHEHGDGADEKSETAEHHHDESSEAPVMPEAKEGSASAVVDAFSAALRAGDEAKVKSLLTSDVIIAEEGGAERSLDEYASHHLGYDVMFMQGVETTQIKRDEIIDGDLASVVTESTVHGSFMGKPVHSRVMETMVLERGEGGWRIRHIHWSSAPVEGEHEH